MVRISTFQGGALILGEAGVGLSDKVNCGYLSPLDKKALNFVLCLKLYITILS